MKLTDKSAMPFGKYQHAALEDVPASYLLWLWDDGVWKDKGKPIHEYIREAFSALESECKDYIVQHPPK